MKIQQKRFTPKELDEFYFSLLEKRDALRSSNEGEYDEEIYRIDQAIDRLKQGKYGLCLSCHEGIEKYKLATFPEIELCRHCEAEGLDEDIA